MTLGARAKRADDSGDRPKRIGLNLLYLVPGETGGTETYARRLLPALSAAGSGLELVAFVNREGSDSLESELTRSGIDVVTVNVSGRGRLRRTLAEQMRLPRLVRSHRIDLLHSLGSTAPARHGTISVVTVHDVIYALHPEAHTRAMRAGMRVLVPLAARGADRVIAISHNAAGEISEVLGYPAERIDVTQLGGRPRGPATSEQELRRRLELGDAPVVLSVSARRPHKNLPRLLEAFARTHPAAVLVLPGYSTPFEDDLTNLAGSLGIERRVRFLGWVSDADLEGLYEAAACFVFPSFAEGFGLPVLEAMQRSVPVACSNASSLPEVADGAARYFDPSSVEEIAIAVDDLLTDPELAERLAAAGAERAQAFSWERAASETIASYERALRSRRRR
jgi:glycosyltransferase involved in cell wall biosynthesis